MTNIHIQSDQLPLGAQGVSLPLASVMVRAAAMGVMGQEPVTALDAGSVGRLVTGLQAHGIGSEAGIVLAPLTLRPPKALDAAAERRILDGLQRLSLALEDSAAPAAEWPAMREVFGDEMLMALVGVGASSLRRYATGERQTPDDLADRLHWLAMVVADLAGAYNAFGVRRWFDRPRAQLDGQSPRAHLGADWSPHDAQALRVRELAGALSGGAMGT